MTEKIRKSNDDEEIEKKKINSANEFRPLFACVLRDQLKGTSFKDSIDEDKIKELKEENHRLFDLQEVYEEEIKKMRCEINKMKDEYTMNIVHIASLMYPIKYRKYQQFSKENNYPENPKCCSYYDKVRNRLEK